MVDFIDFAYLSRDTVSTGLATFNRMVTAVINKASDQIDRIAERRARQVVWDGGKEIGWITPKIVKNPLEEVYKTPFCLLWKFGRKKFYQIKKNSNGYLGRKSIKSTDKKWKMKKYQKNSTIAANIEVETVPESL